MTGGKVAPKKSENRVHPVGYPPPRFTCSEEASVSACLWGLGGGGVFGRRFDNAEGNFVQSER